MKKEKTSELDVFEEIRNTISSNPQKWVIFITIFLISAFSLNIFSNSFLSNLGDSYCSAVKPETEDKIEDLTTLFNCLDTFTTNDTYFLRREN